MFCVFSKLFTTGLAMVSLRKNPLGFFRWITNILKSGEFGFTNSAAMNYSRCYLLWHARNIGPEPTMVFRFVPFG